MPRPDDDREIADASFLFHDPHDARPPSGREGRPEGPDALDPGAEAYELAERAPTRRPPPPPGPIDAPELPELERPGAGRPAAKRLTPAPVDQPWTRLAEWGPTLLRIGLALAALIVVTNLTFSVDRLGMSLALIAAGLGVVLLLSYPIAITLERPVRMTPEHAVRDFYGSLAHHVPHLRRMWLLLSSAGRDAPEFGSYARFHAYWKRSIAELKRAKGGWLTPLSVRIDEFKSDKSAGQEAVGASFTLSFFLRGKEREAPLYATRVETTLSRGPDRMWYLDEGRLPGR